MCREACDHVIPTHAIYGSIRFRLLGVWYGVTLPRFGVLLGFFTAAQSRSGYFSHYFLAGACEPSAEFVGTDFWATIGSGPYLQSNTKESSITLPEHRLLHRMLVHSFAYRKAIKEKVPEGDLWLLSRLVNRNAITNLSHVMANMFQNAGKVHDKAGTGLCGGHFITVIAEKLGTLTPDVCGTLTKLSPMGFIDKALFRSMKLLAPGPRRGTFVWIGDITPMKSRLVRLLHRLNQLSWGNRATLNRQINKDRDLFMKLFKDYRNRWEQSITR
ncbi:hypothetical protein OSB04_006568 [Centaurea solstitialis]|uniref:Uncharacterized protein n=1 Tax=Centaurea solstitialis TaxID=347529 RepID=A0AA38TQS4_9ASTR|nr:hypothetical protein OSB04_006568 [Centaurea solstitialis]